MTKTELASKVAELETIIAERDEAAKVEAAKAGDGLKEWAMGGVVLMSVLSAGLNGYDHSLHAPAAWAGWLMGVMIPVIILVLGTVAGKAWNRGAKGLAYATAGAGVGLLALSIWHCSVAIAALTGSPVWLAVPMAIAIDIGFVACKMATLQK